LIEELGSGIKRMEESMEKSGLPLPKFEEKFNGFSVYLQKEYLQC
jgi:predicted HTH transcriptional regulator